MKNIRAHAAALLFLLSMAAVAKDTGVDLTKEEQAVLQELMVKTKVNMIAGSDAKPDYTSDDDPMTLEIVMLEKGVGIDHVSDDGEVIFMHEKTKEKAQQDLFTKAFVLKTKRQHSEKYKP